MKKIIPILSVIILSLSALTGCSKDYINLKTKHFSIDIGSTVSTDPSDYVNASKTILEEMTVDVSKVNSKVMGTYNASISYGESTKNFEIEVTDLTSPTVTLKKDYFYIELSGKITVDDVVANINDASDYEYGFSDNITAADQEKQLVKELTFSEVGVNTCEVMAKDSYGNYTVKDFTVEVCTADEMPTEDGKPNYRKYMNSNAGVDTSDLNSFDTTGVYYGVGNTIDESTNRPNLTFYELKYSNYKVDFIQPESNYIWLTFNEIYEYGNTAEILDTLKEKNVSAVFFITKSYAENNPELVQRMIDEGHVLGNYTASGADVPDLSVNSLTTEIDTLYNYIHETFGYDMYLFRAPDGYFSEQTLAVAQSLGYRTVFWSFAYSDWNVDNQPDVDTSLQNALDKLHGGAIYQLSGSSSTNKTMLGDFIDSAVAKGYEFAIYQKN